MYIYLRSNRASKCVPGVTLEDGYRPVVGDVGKNLQLEPAIWFKSLIIDSILIDCDRRIIRWGRANVTESAIHREYEGEGLERSLLLEPDNVVESLQLNKSVFEDADCYDFDPKPDELFECARMLLDKYPASAPVDKSFKTEILRLLHCYVLPSIMLSSDDVPSLQKALVFTERKFKGIDAEILNKDRAVVLTENSLLKQRENLLKNEKLNEESYLRQCNPDFLAALLIHIEKDIEGKGVELHCAQEKVNRLKERTNIPKEEERKLAEARRERDELYNQVVYLQEVRECLKNVVVRRNNGVKSKSVHKKPRSNVFHEIYLEICSKLVNEKEQIHKLCLQKVKVSSVREAIQIAIEELKTEGQSIGWQGMLGSVRTVTDILGAEGIPVAWYTLEQKISLILDEPNNEVTQRYWMFCSTICDKIEASLNEQKFFLDMRQDISDKTSDMRERSTSDGFVEIEPNIMQTIEKVCRERRPSSKRSYSQDSQRSTLSSRHTLPFMSLVETIKGEINEHTNEMVARLLQKLPDLATPGSNVAKHTFNKIWTCYQIHLHGKIIEKLEKLYEMAYKKISTRIYHKVGEISLSELGVDEPWLVSVIQNNNHQNGVVILYDRHATEEKRPIGLSDIESDYTRINSVTSGLSVVLGQMSLDELYTSANSEGAKINEEIYNQDETSLKFIEANRTQSHEDVSAVSNIQKPPPYESCSSLFPTYDESDVFDDSERMGRPPQYSETDVHNGKDGRLLSDSLKPGVELLKMILEQKSVLAKMKQITKCYRYVGNEVGVLRSAGVENYMGCCDELLTMLIVLLTQLDELSFTRLYAHMKIVIDLMPQFMIGSVHDCSLTNFHAAFQYLSDRLLMKQSRECSSTCTTDDEI